MKFDPEGKKKYKKPYTGFQGRATNSSPGGWNPPYASSFTKYRARKLAADGHSFWPDWYPKSWRTCKSSEDPEYYLKSSSGKGPYYDCHSGTYRAKYTHGCVGRKSYDRTKGYNRAKHKEDFRKELEDE